MADDQDPDAPPEYRVYRSGPRLLDRLRGRGGDGLEPLRGAREDDRPYAVHDGSGRRRLLRLPGLRRGRGQGRGLSGGRILRALALGAAGWILLSLLIFFVSAQIQRQGVADDAGAVLSGSGYTLTSANTILVLGSDARSKETAEPGSNRVGQPSRSDTILLIRAGGNASARMSIPRDTIVDIPGHGRDKINAAYAFGGPALAVRTVEQYLGLEVNHLVEVNFENFPAFIDALGGVDVRTGCVVSFINGGRKNGGYTLRLKAGENHLDGRAALALARTRKNQCAPAEDDLTRARRQQKILAAIRGRLLSPSTFVRLPLVSWAAPKAVRSDMGGPSLLGLFGAIVLGGTPKTEVLGTVGPDGNPSVTEDVKRQEVEKFLEG